MRFGMAAAIATAVLLAACSTEGGTGSHDGQARWKPVGGPAAATSREPGSRGARGATGTVHIDLNSLNIRGDTVRVRTRIIQGSDTTVNDIEVACSTRMLRRMDPQEAWRSAPPEGLADRIATAACEELTTG